MRWPRRLVSLVLLTVLLVGPPVVLVRLVGWPVPARLPTGQQLRSWVEQPLTEQSVAAGLALLAWLVWLLLAGSVVVGVWARLRAVAGTLRRIPLPTPMQATAGGMAGAAVFSSGIGVGASLPPPMDDRAPAAADAPEGGSDQLRAEQPPAGERQTDPRVPAASRSGVALPGAGWMPRGTAEQVAAAAGLVWLRRRRAYQPGPPGAVRDDVDLTEPPATVAAVQSAVSADSAAEEADSALGGRDTAGHTAEQVSDVPGGDPPLPPEGLPPTGLGLTGTGAVDAARGMLVTVLLAGLRRQPDEVRLVTTNADLAVLLGPTAALADTVAGVRVADTAADAVAVFEAELRHRAAQADDRPAERGSSRICPGPLVLLTHAPASPDIAGRLAAVLTECAGMGSAVLLGRWPAGRTWQVDPAGHTQDPQRLDIAQTRLCVLSAVAATDLLTVIGQACPTPQPNPHPAPAPAAGGSVVSALRVPRQAASPDEPPMERAGPDERPVEIRLLGEPELTCAGTPVSIRRSAGVQVLAFLAVHRQGASGRQLIKAIWPGLDPHTVTGRLYTTVSELRKTLEAQCGNPVMDRAGDRYQLTPQGLTVDLWQLHDGVHHAATALTTGQRTAAWRAVVDSYTGELAAGRDWPWLASPREAIRRHVIDAYAALAAAEQDPRAALLQLHDAIQIDPINEDLHRRTVHALTAAGDHQAALALLDSYRERLTEAHLELGEDLRQVAATLRSGRMLPTG